MVDSMHTHNRSLVIKEGMTPQDVMNSNEATPQQKKMATVFDSDGVAGYSQREADVFNATVIADHGKDGISLWTRYQDDSKKETKFMGDVASFKYAPKGDVKPYVTTKVKQQAQPNEQNTTKEQPSQPELSREEIIKKGYSSLKPAGILRSVDNFGVGDTLRFLSREDSLMYDDISKYYNGLWNIADKEYLAKYDDADKGYLAKYDDADKEYLAKWDNADKEYTAKWIDADKAEREALVKGDMSALKVAREEKRTIHQEERTKKSAIYKEGQTKKSAIYKEGQTKKSAIYNEGQTKKNVIYDEREKMKKEARRTLNIIVHPRKIKD